ncbi:MAG: hypothetical protein MUC88_00190 [Planctomycetes bacterium]|jgi:hypothetical protein|nr:hypothetical protein [Planctomycetota bacterium]
MVLVSFDHIAGVPIHYARQPVAPYGTQGKGPRTVRLEQNFHATLERCLLDLWKRSQLGAPECLVSGGCYVEKAGRHGEGRAIDIDAIWWKDQPPLITRNAPFDARRYLGVEAVLRMHLGMVLNFWYNQAHEDHWHCDDGTATDWAYGSRSRTLFMQAALSYVFGHALPGGIDGDLGPATRRALTDVIFSPSEKTIRAMDSAKWLTFLERVVTAAFGG